MGCVTNITGDTVKEAMTEYILAYTEYHFSDLYEKFTEEEVKEAVGNGDYHYRLAIVKENGTFFTTTYVQGDIMKSASEPCMKY